MSGADIAREIADAIRSVGTEVGEGEFDVVLVRPPALPVNPWDAPGGEPEQFTIPAIVGSFKRGLVDGTLIRATDKRVMLASEGIEPTTADKVVIGGITHAIVSVMPLAPSGVDLMYEVQARA